jgi:hypothetical protein
MNSERDLPWAWAARSINARISSRTRRFTACVRVSFDVVIEAISLIPLTGQSISTRDTHCVSPGRVSTGCALRTCSGPSAVGEDLLVEHSGLAQHVPQSEIVSLKVVAPDSGGCGASEVMRAVVDEQHLLGRKCERLQRSGVDALIRHGCADHRRADDLARRLSGLPMSERRASMPARLSSYGLSVRWSRRARRPLRWE